jgi:orotidine-5'-phosphate decarboxylase
VRLVLLSGTRVPAKERLFFDNMEFSMTRKGFRQRVATRQKAINSLLCVGLDPLPEKMPAGVIKPGAPLNLAYNVLNWMEKIVDATAPSASMFKPQRAHWEALPDGTQALRNLIMYIHARHPDIPIFLDCKRGDIDRTQQQYQIAHFDGDFADGMNFSPYMGKDCLEFLVNKDHPERALVGLCYTSNPAARQVQDAVLQNGQPYWEFIAQCILQWATDLGVAENAGLVMAAAYENPKGSGQIFSDHLRRAREITSDKLWYLIPGYGTQGGFLAETINAAFAGYGSIAINSSSGIIFASQGEDFAEAAAAKAQEAHEQMRTILAQMAI